MLPKIGCPVDRGESELNCIINLNGVNMFALCHSKRLSSFGAPRWRILVPQTNRFAKRFQFPMPNIHFIDPMLFLFSTAIKFIHALRRLPRLPLTAPVMLVWRSRSKGAGMLVTLVATRADSLWCAYTSKAPGTRKFVSRVEKSWIRHE